MPGATQGAKYSLGELKLPRAAWVSLGPNPFFLMYQLVHVLFSAILHHTTSTIMTRLCILYMYFVYFVYNV